MRKFVSVAFASKLLVCSALGGALDSIENVGVSLVQLRADSLSNVTASKPHIVFVLADDLGWNGVSYHSGPKNNVKTPTIDKLAKGGVRLEAYYAAAYCAPSRFAFLTGRAPWKSESGSGNFRADTPVGTSPQYLMLPAALKKAGYATHLIGKWHQGFHMDAYLPTSRGFDTFYGIAGGCTRHFSQMITHEGGDFTCDLKGRSMRDIWENDGPDLNYTNGDNGVFGDDLYRDRAIELIKSHDRSTPFFLFLSLQAPHEPYEIDEKWQKRYKLSKKENIYWGMHSHVDDSVQKVYNALNDAKMYSNTIFIFTSDNGGNSETYQGPTFSNFPLRGHKGQLYEGAIHVPCFVTGGALPGSMKGKTLNGLMAVEDWYATLGHLTGAPPHQGGPWSHDSMDNWKYISGESKESARDEIVQHYIGAGEGGSAVRMSILRNSKYKAVVFGTSKLPEECNACKVCTPEDPCVYDVEADPGETTDVSDNVQDMLTGYIKPRMEETWAQAYKQSWFGSGSPTAHQLTQDKACNTWKSVEGYLTPWASSNDEKSFVRREFGKKVSLSTSSLLSDDPSLY